MDTLSVLGQFWNTWRWMVCCYQTLESHHMLTGYKTRPALALLKWGG